MPGDLEFRGFELTGNPREAAGRAQRLEPGAVRIGVIADLRGRGEQDRGDESSPLSRRRLLRVDRDSLDDVLKRLDVTLRLTISPDEPMPIVLPFRYLEDFHPDRIVTRCEAFAALRSLRSRLQDPNRFDEAAAELTALEPAPIAPSEPEPPREEVANPGDLLDQILQQSSPKPMAVPARPASSPELEAFLRRITAPHIVRELPRQAELIAAVDTATARLLRRILHHPRFQALEALWRSLDLLTRRLETGEQLTIELLDATRAELESDLLSNRAIEELATYKRVVEESVGSLGGRPWSFLVADMTFGPGVRDVALLWRLGQVARLAGAPLLAAASPAFVGCDSLAATADPDDWSTSAPDEGWVDLRQSAEAPYLGLSLPRFLLRAPYGSQSAPIDSFDFEEFDGPPEHEAYLWGNPAFALALLLGGAFDEMGRFDGRLLESEVADLPLPLEVDAEGETRAKPCAEVLLSHRAADRVLAAGLMPLQSVRDRDAVRLISLVSIADPPAPLELG